MPHASPARIRAVPAPGIPAQTNLTNLRRVLSQIGYATIKPRQRAGVRGILGTRAAETRPDHRPGVDLVREAHRDESEGDQRSKIANFLIMFLLVNSTDACRLSDRFLQLLRKLRLKYLTLFRYPLSPLWFVLRPCEPVSGTPVLGLWD